MLIGIDMAQVKDDTLGAKLGRRLGLKKEIITKEVFDKVKNSLKEAIKVKPQALTLKNKKKVVRVNIEVSQIDLGNGVYAKIDDFKVIRKDNYAYEVYFDFRPENGEWLTGEDVARPSNKEQEVITPETTE